jgi:hypothetical protein
MNLTSTVPGVWSAFLGLIQTAATDVTINEEGVSVFAFALTQDEPANYVILTSITNQKFTPESMGYQFREDYNINGYATVYTGASPADDIGIANDVLGWTWDLYNQVVMSTMVENATMPIFGSSPTPFQGLPTAANYTAAPGKVNSGAAGWAGMVAFQYRFSALILPA